MSSSPEKPGRSSKSRTKSPCSPHAVGDTEEDAEVLVAMVVVLSEYELVDTLAVADPEGELDDNVRSWLLVEVALLVSEPVSTVTTSDVKAELDDDDGAWPFAKVVSFEVDACETGVMELKLSEVTVAGPLASELPMEVNACVLGVAELKLALEGLAVVLVMSATPTELAVGAVEIEGASVPDTSRSVLEPRCGVASP